MQWYWAAWFLVGFCVPEFWALASGHPERTLSEVVWHWFDVIPGQTIWQWTIVHFLLFAGLTWAWLHLAFGIWRTWK